MTFEELEQTIREQGADAAFELLVRNARDEGNFRDVFSARVMQARHRAGLPLIQTEGATDPPQETLVQAARETGDLFLAAGDIPGAWPYFRAIGDPAPVAAAIETAGPGDHLDAVIEIAYREGVYPRRGFELILEHRGVCNAITWFGALPQGDVRLECLGLLVRALYDELAASIRSHIAKVEGAAPEGSVRELIAGRDWLFADNNYHTDTTHIASVLRFSPELEDETTMRLALELAEYGTHLGEIYQYKGEPPFDNPYSDHALYLRTLLGQDVDSGVEEFHRKAREGAEAGYGFPAEVFIDLLVRLDRFDEAIAACREFSADQALKLCQISGNFDQLRQISREKGDLLGYLAGVIQARA